MPTHHFFLPGTDLTPGATVSIDPLAHQLTAVLRLAPGATITLLNDSGHAYSAQIQSLNRLHGTALVLRQTPAAPESPVPVTLLPCTLKADRFEWVLQKSTELGVARIVPVVSARSVVRPVDAVLHKYPRWQTILREAAEQSGRTRLPVLAPALSWPEAVTAPTAPGTLRLLPWEAATDVPGVGPAVIAAAPGAVHLLIGPEGGVTPEEATLATAYGWQVVSLGPRILRAETAALAALAIVMDRCGALG